MHASSASVLLCHARPNLPFYFDPGLTLPYSLSSSSPPPSLTSPNPNLPPYPPFLPRSVPPSPNLLAHLRSSSKDDPSAELGEISRRARVKCFLRRIRGGKGGGVEDEVEFAVDVGVVVDDADEGVTGPVDADDDSDDAVPPFVLEALPTSCSAAPSPSPLPMAIKTAPSSPAALTCAGAAGRTSLPPGPPSPCSIVSLSISSDPPPPIPPGPLLSPAEEDDDEGVSGTDGTEPSLASLQGGGADSFSASMAAATHRSVCAE
jgi:hypothetical protein